MKKIYEAYKDTYSTTSPVVVRCQEAFITITGLIKITVNDHKSCCLIASDY